MDVREQAGKLRREGGPRMILNENTQLAQMWRREETATFGQMKSVLGRPLRQRLKTGEEINRLGKASSQGVKFGKNSINKTKG